MASTYEKIATNTLSSAVGTVTFSSIPSTYTDLILVSTVFTPSGTTDAKITFNSDTATNYSRTSLYGDGTNAATNRQSSVAYIYLDRGTLNTTPHTYIVNVMNYSNTTTYKTTLQRMSESDASVAAQVGLWRVNSAINRIDITSSSATNFAIGSTFTLYGIKAA